jgi:hypothetical protein
VAQILSFACALLLVGFASPGARAVEDDTADGESPAVRKTYRKAIKDGVAEYEARHFEEALSYFRKAHQVYPNARTYRGIGMASFELRDYVTAVRSLTAALDEQRKPLSPDQRKETQDLIDRCRLFVAIYTLKISPPEAQATVDANPVELEPDGTLMLGLGVHTIEARLKGYRTRSLSVPVRGGERKELQITLEPTATATRQTPPGQGGAQVPNAALTEPTTPPAPKPISSTVWFLSGGAAAVATTAAGIYWGMQFSELSACRNPPPDVHPRPCKNESTIKLQWDAGAAMTVVAGAATVTFVTLGILARRNEAEQSNRHGELACYPGLLSLSCVRSF